ncbi:MAG: DUF202 domain-containing protein [Candidatus Hydrogenedens sp.]|nr:DUF202 domain-containing protein [Candidatus Hydrogenedentota bacterium]NLF56778.1 DUF202 domain-containing protein [Candidatus Hydrogenedens sp.]
MDTKNGDGVAAANLANLLAVERTKLALERTLLAYVRTALAGAAVGGSSITFLSGRAAFWGGVAFITLSSAVLFYGVWRAVSVTRKLRREAGTLSDDSAG